MLNKRELSTIELPEMPELQGIYTLNGNISPFIGEAGFFIDSLQNRHLMLHIWDTKEMLLIARVFFDASEEKHCSQVFAEWALGKYSAKQYMKTRSKPRWSKGMVISILSQFHYVYRLQNLLTLMPESEELIWEYFGKTDEALTLIENFQKSISKKSLIITQQARWQKSIELMNQIKDLPKDWNKFLNEQAFHRSRYIYYKRKGKKIHGFCTYCNRNVDLDSAKHNSSGICPSCKNFVTLKAEGISKNIVDYAWTNYLHEAEGGFLLRCIEYRKDYRDDFKKPKISQWTEKRFYISLDGVVDMYEYASVSDAKTNEYRQMWRKKKTNDYSPEGYLYHGNLQILRATKWQYSAIDIMAQNTKPLSVSAWVENYPSHKYIEYLVKKGFYNLAVNASYIPPSYSSFLNIKEKTAAGILGTLPEDIAMAAEIDILKYELQAYRGFLKNGYRVTREEFLFGRELNINIDNARSLLFPACGTLMRFLKYFNKQIKAGHTINGLMSVWKDYIQFAKKLKYNLEDEYYIYPKNLIEAHDKADIACRIGNQKKYIEPTKKRVAEIDELYRFESAALLIRAPLSVEEIIIEGNKLKHCVAGHYIDKHALGKTTILIIRQKSKEDEPFYTLELSNDGRIVQVHGLSHKSPTPVVNAFLDSWKKEKVDKKTKTKVAM